MISSNMLVENESDPIIWRGGLITTLLGQFYKDVLWEELDYLLIDMPPGTSDVTLTTFQSIPLDGIIVVTSPQDLVSLIVEKAINMANAMNINILGLVENMSYVECPNCKEKIFLYGEGTTNKLVSSLGIELLAKLPINPLNAEKIDKGEELLKFYYSNKEIKIDDLTDCFEIVEVPVAKPKMIIDIID